MVRVKFNDKADNKWKKVSFLQIWAFDQREEEKVIQCISNPLRKNVISN